MNELKLELDRVKNILEMLEAEISEEDSSDRFSESDSIPPNKAKDKSEESVSLEAKDKVGEIRSYVSRKSRSISFSDKSSQEFSVNKSENNSEVEKVTVVCKKKPDKKSLSNLSKIFNKFFKFFVFKK